VLQDAINLYPANEYDLILWSHGSSWMPNGIDLNTYCGLSCYIPFPRDDLNAYYKTLKWYRDAGLNRLF
jgi:hypothetical protein